MQPVLSTSALALHNLGLAAGFGGSLFGRVAFNPSVHVIKDHTDRGAVVNRAWQRYNWINVIGMGFTAASWLIGRTLVSGRSIDRTARQLTLTKDLLLATSIVTGGATVVAGRMLAQQAPEGRVDLDGGNEASPRTPEKARSLIKFINVAGNVGLWTSAGVIALTAILNMRASRSLKWNLVGRFLP
ncbi:MAG: hypothetical protein ABR567_05720 [Myxococcales bacterium]|nr:hypothetical protein [Myxococcales bacterium]